MEEDYKCGEGRQSLLLLLSAEEKKLELRLGLPGEEGWPTMLKKRESVFKSNSANASSAAKRVFLSPVDSETQAFQRQTPAGFLHLPAKGKESPEKQVATPQSSSPSRTATAPVVGWPPIRSSRKNLAGAAKPSSESPTGSFRAAKPPETERKGLFVKINMDGIPIGRKIDLMACGSYKKLSSVVDELFRGLIAAQMDRRTEERRAITGLLDGSGEFTLVYEDDEGDRMLAGDVPWDMFVSTAKRLRVLKSSDLSAPSKAARNSLRGLFALCRDR
ncbi:hypothetical protein ZIOFF_036687 [Zingiber officinale]|uniref:Auxin-responsive protein n=1 Tax=Zingiber officinale TaxID=94328 RepID=A0A8J5L8A3_ZINOF|nr:hypothetical protein ZIOFF_036687 [Zingiber officinale]